MKRTALRAGVMMLTRGRLESVSARGPASNIDGSVTQGSAADNLFAITELSVRPRGTSARLERVARLPGVVVEHLHGVQRIGGQVLAHQGQLLEDVVGGGDDVAADGVGLEDVEELAGAGPQQLLLGYGRISSTAAAIRGTGSRPVSAMRPTKT